MKLQFKSPAWPVRDLHGGEDSSERLEGAF